MRHDGKQRAHGIAVLEHGHDVEIYGLAVRAVPQRIGNLLLPFERGPPQTGGGGHGFAVGGEDAAVRQHEAETLVFPQLQNGLKLLYGRFRVVQSHVRKARGNETQRSQMPFRNGTERVDALPGRFSQSDAGIVAQIIPQHLHEMQKHAAEQ